MFCSNCGKELPEGTRFCPECGTDQGAAQAPVQQGAAQTPIQNAQPMNNQWGGAAQQQAAQPKKQSGGKKPVALIAGAAAAVIVLAIVILVVVLTHKPTINLNKYVTVTFEGYDTVGTATVEFDYDALEADYGKKLNKTIEVKADSKEEQAILKAWGEDTEEVDVYDFVDDCTDYSLDTESGLSNGDTVTLTWECDEEYALETFGVKLKYEDATYTVEDLEEAETFDPFKYVEVLYSGMSPEGTATVANNAPAGSAAASMSFTMDKASELRNGDTVTVTVNNGDNVEYMLEMVGALPETVSRTYTVDGLAAYAEKLADIPDDLYNEMEQQGEDEITAYIAEKWTDPSMLRSIEMIGNYFLTPKNTLDSNYLDFIYKIYYEGDEGEESFYWYVGFSDIIIMSDGTASVDITSTTVPSGSYNFFTGDPTGEAFKRNEGLFVGYEDLADLFNNEVTQYVANYNYENTVTEN